MRGTETIRSAITTIRDNSGIVHREKEKVCTDFYAKLNSVPQNIIPISTQKNGNIQPPTNIIAPITEFEVQCAR
ncbi:unnamed protein product [Arctia plantaginis]|uniref:Uncharacterized protein n=1 Tax=Arctia plantaginis TaxID=874455 RepID=A0A8S0ZMT1_ARCPL|nr:unnamed protein product [Arctia plantaginis]